MRPILTQFELRALLAAGDGSALRTTIAGALGRSVSMHYAAETYGQTHCPADPRRVPGCTPLAPSNQTVPAGADLLLVAASYGPVPLFVGDTHASDLLTETARGEWRDDPVYLAWLYVRRYPDCPRSYGMAAVALGAIVAARYNRRRMRQVCAIRNPDAGTVYVIPKCWPRPEWPTADPV